MGQIAWAGQMALGNVSDIPNGGVCVWRLPPDSSCASVGRSLLNAAMTGLGLDRELVENAVLAGSELVTNALNHGLQPESPHAVVSPELWVWARATPVPQIVLGVFDICRRSWPDTARRDLLDEHGKGIGIVDFVADRWGAHLSRSRLCPQMPGKVVWCAFGMTGRWPDAALTAAPAVVARHLALAVTARGVENVEDRHRRGVALVSVPVGGFGAVNVWVEPRHLTLTSPDGARDRRPLVDLHDLVEDVVRRNEESEAGR